MENIAEKEKIEVTENELEEMAKEESEKINIPVDKLIKYYKDSNRLETMVEEKVIKFLKENNKIKEVDPTVKNENSAKDSENKHEDVH